MIDEKRCGMSLAEFEDAILDIASDWEQSRDILDLKVNRDYACQEAKDGIARLFAKLPLD